MKACSEEGSALAKLVVWLLVLAVLASIGLFLYVRSQEPLATGPIVVSAEQVRMQPNQLVYVATFVRNTGSLPVTLQGLGELGDVGQDPYIPVEIRLGTGDTPAEGGTARLTEEGEPLDAGVGVGVLVIYAPNPDLICKLLPEEPTDEVFELSSFPVRYTTYGISKEQTLTADEPFATIERPTVEECEAAVAG